jgi:hypothetical protein
MAKLVELIPNMSDRELLTLFRNASNLVAEGKNVQNAESAIFAIERQWKKQLDNTADNDHTIPATGMLATLGYHVGSAQGEKACIRRRILKHILERQLPMVSSRQYTEEWGLPNSSKRYRKLIQFFHGQLNNPANSAHEQAMIEWSEDLGWVQQQYAHLLC